MAYGIKRTYSMLTETAKAVGVFSVIGGALFSVWASTVGPGLTYVIQEAAGTHEIIRRVDRIEANLVPLKVVDWEEHLSGQRGACTSTKCHYELAGARTEYGDKCGRVVSATVKLKRIGTSDTRIIKYANDFQFVKLTTTVSVFPVSLSIPEYVQPGEYLWRSETEYAHCPGINEPMTRLTPWWPLTISK